MFNPSLPQKNISALLVLLFVVLLFLFAIPTSVSADHTRDGNRCGDVSPQNGKLTAPPGPGGSFVPVKDFEAENYLEAILENTGTIEGHIDGARQYLHLLCEKEFELDPDLQNAWAETIGRFVDTTRIWVAKVYNGNPAFITSPHIYAILVDKNVILTFLREVRDSDIGEDARRTIIRSILSSAFQNVFPYDVDELEFAEDDLGQKLTDNFWQTGGFQAFDKLQRRSGQEILSVAFAELDSRRSTTLAIERDKLNWGRGFFSYEQCDLEVYSQDLPPQEQRQDRRNCRIVTPGSTIQDLTSFVFGSALRQMELADEYEEFVAENTIATLNDALNYNGLITESTRTGVSQEPIGPNEATGIIDFGNTKLQNNVPAEYDFRIDPDFDGNVLDQIREDFERDVEEGGMGVFLPKDE